MNKHFTALLFTVFLLAGINAQVLIVEPKIKEVSVFDTAELNMIYNLDNFFSIANNTDEKIGIIWKRIVPEICPVEWLTNVCDINICYPPNISTNYDPDIGIEMPAFLDAGESFNSFALSIYPFQVPGCCQMKLLLSLIDAPDEIIETVYFNVNMVTPDCSFPTPSTERLEAGTISLYPNPTSGLFTLTFNDAVKKISVFNILGKKMKSWHFQNGQYIDISDLANGLYLVCFQTAEGDTLKTLHVFKQAAYL